MKNVTAPTSDSWLNALIESLQNPAEAAAYLSVAKDSIITGFSTTAGGISRCN